MKKKQIQYLSASVKFLDLVLSILILKIVNSISIMCIPYSLIIALCLLITIKWVVKRMGMNCFIDEIKTERTSLLSHYFNSECKENISTHLIKILETDMELCLTYETQYKIDVFFDVAMIVIYEQIITSSNIILGLIVLVIGITQGIIPKFFEKKFSSNYENTVNIEEEIENFYYGIMSHFEKCYFLPVKYLVGILNRKNIQYMKIGVRSEATAQKYNGFLNAINIFSQIGVCFVCLLLSNNGQFVLQKLLGIVYLSIQTINIFSEMFQIVQTKPSALIAKKRVDKIMTSKASKDLDRPIKMKKLVLIKGGNGAGKSTLLKNILLQESEEFFYLPQNELLLDMTPWEMFAIFPEKNKSDVKELFMWNEELSERSMLDLSLGERKKVELMCAFMSNRNLYMDEPENALDNENRELFLRAIKNYSYKIVIATNSDIYNELQREEINVNYA